MMYFTHSVQGSEMVIRKEIGKLVVIPNDPANSDYRAYLAWVAEGNTAEEWSPEA